MVVLKALGVAADLEAHSLMVANRVDMGSFEFAICS